jgi:mRNA-degrading endonuclease RelE of RelBE toxin-antitoxin system
MYEIDYTARAIEDLRWFKKYEQNQIVHGIDKQLRHQPTVPTRNRKRTRPNVIAEWELRIGDFRVFYDVEEQVRIVEIQRIGEKHGNEYFFQGRKEDI